jgi:8-oxo-dGTP pyrophosphatase MutT (NUDIX family)
MAGAPTGDTASALVPAATVVLLRDGPEGPETLLLRRNSKLVFAGGHWVFPGGRLDAADLVTGPPTTGTSNASNTEGATAPFPGLVDEDVDRLLADPALTAAARRAAVREAQEETGLVLDPADLAWFAHWTPPPSGPRRFATWFFVATAPGGEIRVDGGEIHEHQWMRPADAHARRDAGAIELSPPTWVTLWQLRPYATAREAVAGLTSGPPRRYSTRMVPARSVAPGGDPAAGADRVVTEEHLVALWDGDAAYPDRDLGRPGARHRREMRPDGWRFRDDG